MHLLQYWTAKQLQQTEQSLEFIWKSFIRSWGLSWVPKSIKRGSRNFSMRWMKLRLKHWWCGMSDRGLMWTLWRAGGQQLYRTGEVAGCVFLPAFGVQWKRAGLCSQSSSPGLPAADHQTLFSQQGGVSMLLVMKYVVIFSSSKLKKKLSLIMFCILFSLLILADGQRELTVRVIAVSSPPPLRYISVSRGGQVTVWNSSLRILRSFRVSE